MDSVTFKITGDKILSARIRALTEVADSKHIRAALRKGSRPIIVEARARVRSKTIALGIRLIRVVRNAARELVAEIGLPGGRRPWFYGLFLERGTGPRWQRKTRRFAGSMPAKPFLRPAADTKHREAAMAFFGDLKRRVEEAARRG